MAPKPRHTTNTRSMTPKEKAKQLVDKFDGVGLQMRNEAIACALIAIDEIISVIDNEMNFLSYLYFKEVKQEIKKL
jgi:hypothetical protein